MRRNLTFTLVNLLGSACLVLSGLRLLPLQGDEQWLPNQVGKWKPVTIDPGCCREDYKLSQSEYDTYMKKLKRLAGIMREVKVLNPPLGFEGSNSLSILRPGHSDMRKSRPYVPVAGLVRLMLEPYVPTKDGGTGSDSNSEGWLAFYINTIIPIFGGERHTHKEVRDDWVSSGNQMEDEQGPYFLAPKVVGDLQGFPIYDTHAVIFTKSQKPLWIPVSQERFLRHALRRSQELFDAQIADLRTSTQGLPTDATGETEDSRRVQDATMRATLAQTPGNIRFLRADYVKALREELASLSPAQRAAPAYYSPDWKTTPRASGLLAPGTPKAQPVVSPNPDFFNPALPRTSIQVVVVLGISARDRPPANPERANPASVRLFEVRQTLDWSKIAALVE